MATWLHGYKCHKLHGYMALCSCFPAATVSAGCSKVDGVTDLLLDGVGDTVLYSSLSCFLASRTFALLARGPFLIGEANLFPRVIVGSFFALPFGKCLEQTRWWALMSPSCKWNTRSQMAHLPGSLGNRWKEALGSLNWLLAHTRHDFRS